MLLPEDQAKPCSLSLEEIEKRLEPEQLSALRRIWRGIKGSRLPIRTYLDTVEMGEAMLEERARVLFEASTRASNHQPQNLVDRVISGYGALAWLAAKANREGLERKTKP